MGKESKTALDQPLGGLSLMTLLTAIWVIIGEINLKGKDFYALGVIFTVIISLFISFYLKLNKRKAFLPKIEIQEDPKKEKRYWIIFVAEGLAIFLAKNILVNLGKDELFISCVALIVGLHFFPLAKVFERKFDYYIGSWTSLFAFIAIFLSLQHSLPQNFINAIVCFACATATSLYALNMISNAKKIVAEISNANTKR